MEALFNRALIAAYVAIIVVPSVNTALRVWPQSPLEGVSEPVPKPTLTPSDFAHERYQKGYVAWFERNYGLRSTAVRLDSSVEYYVFHEAPAESRVRIGDDGVLFIDEDVDHFNRMPDVPTAEIEDTARRLARLQTKLRNKGKALLLVITPSKTSLFPAQVPAAWRRHVVGPRPSDAPYEAFVRALRRAGVGFADAHALLQNEQTARGIDMFPSVGRHWNELGACLSLREAAARAPASVALREIDCGGSTRTNPAWDDEELDLWRLLNVWGAPSSVAVPRLPVVPMPASDVKLPTAIFVGTSFSWRLMFESERSHLFGTIHFYYYNKTVVDRVGTPFYPVEPNSSAWRDLTLSRDVYIVELPEWYLPGANADFFDQIDRAFED